MWFFSLLQDRARVPFIFSFPVPSTGCGSLLVLRLLHAAPLQTVSMETCSVSSDQEKSKLGSKCQASLNDTHTYRLWVLHFKREQVLGSPIFWDFYGEYSLGIVSHRHRGLHASAVGTYWLLIYAQPSDKAKWYLPRSMFSLWRDSRAWALWKQ